MLEHSKAELGCNRSLSHLQNTIFPTQSSYSQEHTLRKRVHALMSENFELKQMISSLQNELKLSQEAHCDTRNQLRAALEEMESNDQIIETQKCHQSDLKQQIRLIQGQVSTLREELQQKEQALEGVVEHNRNLETEIQLLSELKHKYQLQNAKSKAEAQKYEQQYALINGQNEQLNQTVKSILHEYQEQQHQLACRRQQMQQYQSYVLSKLAEAKKDPQFHEKCRAQKDKYYCKYLKYKEKANLLRRERDQLLGQLASVSQEVGSASMRKYVE